MGSRPKRIRRRKPRLPGQRHLLNLSIAFSSGAIAFGFVTFIANPESHRSPASISQNPAKRPGSNAEAILAIREEAHQILLDYQAAGGPRASIPKDQLTQKSRYEMADAARLERLGRKLQELDPSRFPQEASWRNHLASLLGEMSATGPYLSKLLLSRHGTAAHNAAVQAWNETRERIKKPVNEDDPRVQAIREEALALLIERNQAGPPQPRPNPDPAPESLDAVDRRQLEGLSLQLHQLDPEHFPGSEGIENIAILIQTVPDHGKLLAELIRTSRKKSNTFLPLHQKWLDRLEELGITQYEEPKRIHEKRSDHTHLPPGADSEGLKKAAKAILDRYPETAIPIWNGLPGLAPQERRLRKLDFTALVSISARLAKRDPERFIAKNNLENLARLFENDGPEGAALATVLRTNRITEAKQFPERVRLWREIRETRAVIDCLESR